MTDHQRLALVLHLARCRDCQDLAYRRYLRHERPRWKNIFRWSRAR